MWGSGTSVDRHFIVVFIEKPTDLQSGGLDIRMIRDLVFQDSHQNGGAKRLGCAQWSFPKCVLTALTLTDALEPVLSLHGVGSKAHLLSVIHSSCCTVKTQDAHSIC